MCRRLADLIRITSATLGMNPAAQKEFVVCALWVTTHYWKMDHKEFYDKVVLKTGIMGL